MTHSRGETAYAPAPRARNRDSREVLLRIAARMFRDNGYTATSIRDIVSEAQIEPSALYYHFASKEALLDVVLERSILNVMADVREALEALPAATPPRRRFEVAIAAHIRAIRVHGDYALASRRVIGQVPPAIRRKHDAMRTEYGAYWQHLFALAAAQGEFRNDAQVGLARMFLMGALNWTSEWFDARRKSPEAVAAVFCGILFDGLGPAGTET